MKHVTSLDNPLNGYADGHSDSEDLGIFVLSPGVLNIRNRPPDMKGAYFWLLMENVFRESREDFYDPRK